MMMKRFLPLILALALVAVPPSGLTHVSASTIVTYESITVAAVSIGLAALTVTPGAGQSQTHQCLFRLETAEIRYRWDGTAPTSSEGILLEPGEQITIATAEDAIRIRFIRTTATSGVLKGGCWR